MCAPPGVATMVSLVGLRATRVAVSKGSSRRWLGAVANISDGRQWPLAAFTHDGSSRQAPVAVFAAAAAAAVVVTTPKPTAKGNAVLAETGAGSSALSPLQVMDVTNMVIERVSLPMVPTSMQEAILAKCVQHVSDELPKYLTSRQLQNLRAGVDKAGSDISTQEREKLVKAMADTLQVALLPSNMREKVACVIIDAVLGDVTVAGTAGAFVAVAGTSIGSAGSLLDADGRKRIATRLNEQVDLPLLNEEQEQVLFEKFVDAVVQPLEKLIPEDMRSHLKAASAAELEALKQHLTETLLEKLPGLPFLDKEKERQMLRVVVDFIVETFIDHSGLDGVLLTPEVQLMRIKQAEQDAIMAFELARRQNARREAAMKRHLASVRAQKAQLEREVGHSFAYTAAMTTGISALVACLGAAVAYSFVRK